MATNNSEPNKELARISQYQLQKYNNHPIIEISSKVVKLEEAVKTVWSNECDKSAQLRSEFVVWDEYDCNHG